MQVKIEIDCTPLEARQFFGLPDVQPMQAAVMAQVEKRVLDEIEKFSPEALIRNWFSLFALNAEQFQETFARLFVRGSGEGNPPS